VVGLGFEKIFVDLGVCTTRLKVHITVMGTYDLIIGVE
jgi:hypothetical protein